MARIAGVNIPPQKRVEIGLTYIYGVGRSTSNKVLSQLGIDPDTKVRDLTEEEWREVTSIAAERHFALNWLCGYAPGNRWDATPTET